MSAISFKNKLQTALRNFASASIINSDGALLYSKDQGQHLLTTTRLVAFQIIKKYLQPQPLDFFILNDPENGGYSLNKVIFFAALKNNLYLVWDVDFQYVDFKIPPTPLFDQGLENEFAWKALVQSQSFASQFQELIRSEKEKVDQISSAPSLIDFLNQPKNQSSWLKFSQEAFDYLLTSKAMGTSEAYIRIKNQQMIKLRFTAEEKQNVKSLSIDFTNTNMANEISAASHVIESSLVHRISEFYDLREYLTYSTLDKIKIILPPRSIVSKPHSSGIYNYELQQLTAQLFDFVIFQLNSHSRKPHASFKPAPFIAFKLIQDGQTYENFISLTEYKLAGIEQLIHSQCIEIQKFQSIEKSSAVKFKVLKEDHLKLEMCTGFCTDQSDIQATLNGEKIKSGKRALKANDLIELSWSKTV